MHVGRLLVWTSLNVVRITVSLLEVNDCSSGWMEYHILGRVSTFASRLLGYYEGNLSAIRRMSLHPPSYLWLPIRRKNAYIYIYSCILIYIVHTAFIEHVDSIIQHVDGIIPHTCLIIEHVNVIIPHAFWIIEHVHTIISWIA